MCFCECDRPGSRHHSTTLLGVGSARGPWPSAMYTFYKADWMHLSSPGLNRPQAGHSSMMWGDQDCQAASALA